MRPTLPLLEAGLAIVLGGLLAFADQPATVTLAALNTLPTYESVTVYRGGVNADGATTYVEEFYYTTTITKGGSVVATPTLLYLATVVEDGSQWSAEGTAFSNGDAYKDGCSIFVSLSSSFLACTETDYALGVAVTTQTYTSPVIHQTITFPNTPSSATPTSPTTVTHPSPNGAIIGGVVGSVIFLVTVATLLILCRYRRRADPTSPMGSDKAMQSGLDSPRMDRALPQLPFQPAIPRQPFGAGPSQFNPYNNLEVYTGAIESPERSPRSMSFPSPTHHVMSQPMEAGRVVPGPSLPNSSMSPSASSRTGPGPDKASSTLRVATVPDQDMGPELERLRVQVARLEQQVAVSGEAPPGYSN